MAKTPKKITVWLQKVGMEGGIVEIDRTLEAAQKLVGGYVEVVSIGDGFHLVCDEEGILKGKPFNWGVAGHMIHGDFFICRGGGSFQSLKPGDEAKLATRFTL